MGFCHEAKKESLPTTEAETEQDKPISTTTLRQRVTQDTRLLNNCLKHIFVFDKSNRLTKFAIEAFRIINPELLASYFYALL